MIKRQEFTIKSNHDNLDLGVTMIVPEHPRGLLQIVHGMAEHRRRYYDFMEYCAEQGLAVIIHDHRGHGDSIKAENDLGYFYEDGARGMIDDAHQVTEYFKNQFPGLPLTLLGHSMGSLVVRCCMKTYDADVDGLIVCGSPSKRFGVGAGKLLVRLLQLVQGDRHRSKFVSNTFNNLLAKKYLHEGSVNSWIASDPAVVAAYDADKRNGFTFTLNGYENLFTLSAETYSPKGWQMHHPDLPIFFIAGADDPCIIGPQDFQKAVNFMRTRGYQNVSDKLYPGLRHEILNERGKQEVWNDVVTWIDQQVIA